MGQRRIDSPFTMRPMPGVRSITLVATASLSLAGGTALAAAPDIDVRPVGAYRGELVRVSGNAGNCMPGNTVTLISGAFGGTQEFAGVPAIPAVVRSGGSFSVRTRIPRGRAIGLYTVSGRCGGGNLGATARLRVRRARRCGNYTFDGPGEADELSFIRIRTRRVRCRSARRLMRRVAAAGDPCPAHWTCVYPSSGRATWTRGRKRITFSPAG